MDRTCLHCARHSSWRPILQKRVRESTCVYSSCHSLGLGFCGRGRWGHLFCLSLWPQGRRIAPAECRTYIVRGWAGHQPLQPGVGGGKPSLERPLPVSLLRTGLEQGWNVGWIQKAVSALRPNTFILVERGERSKGPNKTKFDCICFTLLLDRVSLASSG